jgi:hypothetical protein
MAKGKDARKEDKKKPGGPLQCRAVDNWLLLALGTVFVHRTRRLCTIELGRI